MNRIKYTQLKHQETVVDDERGSSSPLEDFFEFFYDPMEAYKISHAEDIIFCGKILPKDNYKLQQRKSTDEEGKDLPSEKNKRRSSSLEKPRRLNFKSKEDDDGVAGVNHRRRPPTKISTVDKSNSTNIKPSWHFLVLGGLVKASPLEVDIRDMKSRQSRLSSSTFLPEGNIPASKRRSHRLRGNDLLEVLSCKSQSTLSFTEPTPIVRRPTSIM